MTAAVRSLGRVCNIGVGTRGGSVRRPYRKTYPGQTIALPPLRRGTAGS